ncbi:hypothetical protein [Fictibacillus phosphorivorans]|uniref:hypothetical protein n=1 Tax=Fictibacillus phosphorivorans TaxID=1221500 RepID=UPI00129326A1|nr:hypothetical protein [Fictibacillus phosphorivorans]MQR96707.1 hypothetical protein [Fictibacillus phosphorivorans]
MRKKRIEKIEKVIIEYGNIVELFESEKISFKEAQLQSTELFKEAIKKKLMLPPMFKKSWKLIKRRFFNI